MTFFPKINDDDMLIDQLLMECMEDLVDPPVLLEDQVAAA